MTKEDTESDAPTEGQLLDNTDTVEGDSIFEIARELETKDRGSLEDDPDTTSFKPAEAVWMIDAFLTQQYSRTVGAIAAVTYTQATLLLFLTVWLSFFYLLTFSNSSGINGATWAAFSVTMGSFVLVSGSNLVDYYNEEELNFTAYIHNAITFIVSGIFLAVGYILDSFFEVQLNISLDLLPSLILITNNILGTLFFTLSIWVILKILWRLNQLIAFRSKYADKSPYSELRATIAGFYMGLTRGGEVGIFSAMLSLGATIGVVLVPYILTSNLLWSVVAFLSLIGLNIFLNVLSYAINHYRSANGSSE